MHQSRTRNPQKPASQPALLKKTFVHSDIYNYSTRQNKVEQSRTVDQRFEQWIKGSSKKKFIRKGSSWKNKLNYEIFNCRQFSVFKVNSSQRNLTFNIL